MTLTEQWKKGELEALDKLIKQIKTVDDSRALSDKYLEDRGLDTRRDYDAVCEWGYGVTWIIVDYVLPYLKQVQQLEDLLKECKSSVLFEADVVKETSGKHSKDYKMLASILTKINEVLK